MQTETLEFGGVLRYNRGQIKRNTAVILDISGGVSRPNWRFAMSDHTPNDEAELTSDDFAVPPDGLHGKTVSAPDLGPQQLALPISGDMSGYRGKIAKIPEHTRRYKEPKKRKKVTIEHRVTPCAWCRYPLSVKHHILPIAIYGENNIAVQLCANCHEIYHIADAVFNRPTKSSQTKLGVLVMEFGEADVRIQNAIRWVLYMKELGSKNAG